MRKLMPVMVVAAVGLLLVEVMVLGVGSHVSQTLALLSLIYVLLAVGLWGFNARAQPHGVAAWSAHLGALIATAGLLISAVPPWPVARSWDLELGQVVRDSPLYSNGLIAATMGLVLVGFAYFVDHRFHRWSTLALIVCPPIAMLIMLNEGPFVVGNLAGVAVGLGLTSMVFRLLGARSTATQPQQMDSASA